ncbi:MAG: hypothetical protein A2W09_03865 [Deltaproteobacteria bacterium RBG_16_50_11]|nr:MAG: hypothetical protein A2W09_03865 [Deltaproteobacteria bacterium RBG_16_50_11]
MIEIYATSRPQDGGKANEDAFFIHRGTIPFAALCDGAGKAEQSAKRALSFFEKLFKEAKRDDIDRFPTWVRWVKLLDSSLLGGNQSTFIAIAVLEDRYVGTCVGDSRVYLRDRDGQIHIITENAVTYRLGSGKVDPFPIYLPCNRGDLLLLMSGGAWTPLNINSLKKLINKSLFGHLSELPPAILDEAGKDGKGDDMTVIAMKKTN